MADADLESGREWESSRLVKLEALLDTAWLILLACDPAMLVGGGDCRLERSPRCSGVELLQTEQMNWF